MRREPVLLAAVVMAVAGCPSPVAASSRGTLTVTPAASIDTAPIRVRTSAGCPDRADGYYAAARGHGFPEDGQIVTAPTAAGMSHRAGFDAYFAQTMKDFAADNHTTLTGRYDVTVYCVEAFTRTVFSEFAGSLTFLTPHTYRSGDASVPSAAATASNSAVDPADSPAAVPSASPAVAPAVSPGVASAARPAVASAEPTGPLWYWIAVTAAAVLGAFEAGRRLGRRNPRST